MTNLFINDTNKKELKTLFNLTEHYKLKIIYITILRAVNSISTIGVALITKNMVDASINQNIDDAIRLGVFAFILLLLKLVLSKYTTVYTRIVKEKLYNELQLKIISNYYNNSWLFMNKFKTGDLITRATNDISKITRILLRTFPKIISLFIQLITAFIILSTYDRLIASLAFIIGPATISCSWFLGHKLKTMQKEIQEAISELNSFTTETIQNMDLIHSFNIKSRTLNTLSKFQIEKQKLIRKKVIFSAVTKGVVELGFTLGYLGAILIGAYKLYQSEITFGTFVAFSQLVTHIQNPIFNLSKSIPSVITVLSSIERINDFILPVIPNSSIDNKLEVEWDSLEFDSVSFGYSDKKLILDKINLKIEKNETIAIIGKSGEGKTTVLRLIMSMVPPSSGSVYLHNNKTKKIIDSETQKYFSYVPQSNSLFSGSILSNLQLANPEVSIDQINEALKATCIYDYISTLPDGLETNVGERLGGLSEGQAQRICIARALIHDTPFLILDEATSALDMSTEKEIINNISKIFTDKSVIIVTHKTEILNHCDKIYTIQNKKVVQINS